MYLNGLADTGGLLCLHDKMDSTADSLEQLINVLQVRGGRGSGGGGGQVITDLMHGGCVTQEGCVTQKGCVAQKGCVT